MEQIRDFNRLASSTKEHFTQLQNPEMVALIIASEYMYETLRKICSSKMYQQLPAVASEAITTVDEISQKVLRKVEQQTQTTKLQ